MPLSLSHVLILYMFEYKKRFAIIIIAFYIVTIMICFTTVHAYYVIVYYHIF
jgi:hypothetical protein